ncbi:MurR/RpiR family transcriptional regulator [Martelella endophytica]|uniref:RpiR family transcriptional regulator n=1 Tax=Martelella endophytica TaxID=1486262 RepID=A0A0D5LXJ9_MAREN|nr:MurR/RpiR family transcriptional regulator [Martelella endophytica]AJY48183.1 RpiR family transcriptional regulator [Martelella endophytica]
MDIYMVLQEERDQFSQAEKRICDILLNDSEFAVNASIVELAERAGVSPPTVTRFCRRLSCQNFADFKVQLAKTAYVGVRYLNPEARSSGAEDVAADVVTKAQNALFLMHRSLDLQSVETAARMLVEAEMIYAFGSGGNSSMIAAELQNRLFRLGKRITTSADHSMQLMLTAAAGPKDVIIGSSFSGRNHELARTLDIAGKAGIATIALTQSGSTVASAAGVVIGVDLPEGENIYRPTSTRFAYLALIDILANLVAYLSREQSAPTLRNIKKQLVLHRDKDDSQLLGD